MKLTAIALATALVTLAAPVAQAATPADLVVLTGDYMDLPGDEEGAIRALRYLAGVWKPRYGAFATFGRTSLL